MNFTDAAPFISGFAVQTFGSILQHLLLAPVKKNAPTELQRMKRDGDLVQFVCTAAAVTPGAAVLLHDRLWLLLVTSTLSVGLVAISLIRLLVVADLNMYNFKNRMFSKLSILALALCAAGAVVAFLGGN